MGEFVVGSTLLGLCCPVVQCELGADGVFAVPVVYFHFTVGLGVLSSTCWASCALADMYWVVLGMLAFPWVA